MKNLSHYKKLAKQFNALKTDEDRFAFLKNNDDFVMIVDNDATYPAFADPEDYSKWSDDDQDEFVDITLNDFDDDYWDTDGICALFAMLGINAEPA